METGYHKAIIASLADIANELSSARDWESHLQNALELICETLPVSTVALGVRFGGWKSFSCGVEEIEELDVALAANYSFFSGACPQPELSSSVPISGAPRENTVALPVTKADEVVGVLQVEFAEGRSYSVDDVQALGVVAALVGSYLQTVEAVQGEARARKEAEESSSKVRQSEQRFRAFVTTSSDVVYRMSPDWSEMLQLQGREFIADTENSNRNWLDNYIHPDDQPHVLAVINEAVRTKNVFALEHRVLRVDGTLGWMYSRAVPLLDANGEIVEWIGAASDITDRKQIEQQREELLQREQHIAEMLQQALVPPDVISSVGDYRIAVRYRAAWREAEVGGDFYDVFDLEDRRIGILIGDVGGKGLNAAVRVAAARYAIRDYAYLGLGPGETMERANDSLCKDKPDEGGELTAFFAVLDANSGTMTYASGGHEPPLLAHSDGRIEELACRGMMMSVISGVSYQECSFTFRPGDRLIAVTDGITEARDENVELFNKSGMLEYIRRNPMLSAQELVDGLLDAATAHAGGRLQDDAAVMIVEQR